MGRQGGVPCRMAGFGQSPRGLTGATAQPDARILEPALEVWGAGDEEALEQVAPVELERLALPCAVHGTIEGGRVTPEIPVVDTDFLVATALERAFAERLPQAMQGLAERSACMLLVELGPE